MGIDDLLNMLDSLYSERITGASGEYDPMFPNIKMFDESGDYSEKYKLALENFTGNPVSFHTQGGTPRDVHYESLIGQSEQDLIKAQHEDFNPGLLSSIKKSYEDATYLKPGPSMVSPYNVYNVLNEEILGTEGLGEQIKLDKYFKENIEDITGNILENLIQQHYLKYE